MLFYINKTTKLTSGNNIILYNNNKLVTDKCTDDIHELLADIKFSEKRSSACQKEEATYIYFIDYLEECERGKVFIYNYTP